MVNEPSLTYNLTKVGVEEVDLCLSQGHKLEVKRKQPRSLFELGSPIPFSSGITVTLSVNPLVYIKCNKRSQRILRCHERSKLFHIRIRLKLLKMLALTMYSFVKRLLMFITPFYRIWLVGWLVGWFSGMLAIVGSFFTEATLTIIVFNYVRYKNILPQ